MSVLNDMFGEGSTAEQFFMWAVLAEVVHSLLQPFFNLLQQSENAAFQTVKLQPETLADLVVKGWTDQDTATATARNAGITGGDFDLLVKGTGEPIGLQDALFAWRRGYIPFDAPEPGAPSVETAIKTSHIANLWADTIKKLGLVPISVADAVDGVVEGQIPYAQGEAIAYQNGVSNDDFRILYNTRGNPPGPSELVEFVRRGLIPLKGAGPTVLSLEQGIYEGASKDKWEPMFEQLVRYVPPPRTITAVYKAGGYTKEQATALYIDNGLTPEDAAAYIAGATGEKIAGTVQIALSTIDTLYYDQIINRDTALAMLGNIGYAPDEAAFELSVQDLKRQQSALNSAVSRVGTLYINHKLSVTQATAALNKLHVPDAQAQGIIQTWTLEAGVNVKILTEAQIVDGWSIEALTDQQAIDYLSALGYSPFDAWVLLSIKNKTPLPNPPPQGPEPFYTPPPGP